jgi:hypothetical protein
MRELHGDRVRLRVIPLQAPGLLGRLRRLPQIGDFINPGEATLAASLTDDLLSSIEARALWSRYGL